MVIKHSRRYVNIDTNFEKYFHKSPITRDIAAHSRIVDILRRQEYGAK